jgi:uncharacterized protein (TIGR00251 family)
MGSKKQHLHSGKTGSALAVRVTPRSSKNEIVGILNDGVIKIHLTAPPIEGKANEALIKFLAEILDISKSQLDVVVGLEGRDKIISVINVDSETLQKKIMKYIK